MSNSSSTEVSLGAEGEKADEEGQPGNDKVVPQCHSERERIKVISDRERSCRWYAAGGKVSVLEPATKRGNYREEVE